MASNLRLILSRYISNRPNANLLSLPLDRKLGDITRHKYVLANTLPLRLERLGSEQPSANALNLGMMQPLSTIAPPLYFVSNSLPLPLTVATSNQPQANVLPLGMSRKLGTVVGDTVTPPVGDDVSIAASAIADITPTASVVISTIVDDDVSIAITATANITPTASVSVTIELVETAITVTAHCDLNATASVTASYDANVFRGLANDVSGGFEQSKALNSSASSGFEPSKQLAEIISSDWQQSRLIGDSNQAQFESSDRLITSSQAMLEQSKLIGDSIGHHAGIQRFVSDKAQLRQEQARLVGQGQWYGFEAMAKRQISRAISTENCRLIADSLGSFVGSAKSISLQNNALIEFARLPYSELRYVPPPLSQTVILKEQIIDGWECGSGKLHHYVYHDELSLPMHRLISDRGDANGLAMPLSSPRGVLKLSADDANALPNYPCKRKTLGVNPKLDVTLCQPKVFGKASSVAVNAQAALNAIAWLELLISEQADLFGSGVIFVINDLLLTRIDSGDEIKMLSFNVGIDNSSYCWTFSANVPFAELSKVDITNEPEIEVELMVNGQAWRFILDACDDNTQFNSSSLSIKGKSRASRLAYPFAQHRGYKYTAPMTARQIANDELNRASIPSGFTLDWQLVSELGWNVPANTYSYSNRTPINSLQWIAEAAGGFINSHPSDDVIRVLSNYPIPSWEWAEQTPSIIIPEQLITSRSRKRVQKSRYNGVMVSGEREGSISALVKRSGTSGGYTPNQVVSDLITDTAVARHRGQCVLSDTGDIGNIGLSLPMHSAIGLLTPSTLIRVNDGGSWVGMVRGTTISGSLGGNGSLQIEQSIDVERHFDKEFV